jgi:hypothetical protein
MNKANEILTNTQDKANDAFHAWERANNEQDMSDRDRMLWTAGWVDAMRLIPKNETSSLVRAMELYKLLNQVGLEFEVVEIMEGIRVLRVCVEEVNEEETR